MNQAVEIRAYAPDATWYVQTEGLGSDPPVVVLAHGVGLDLDMWDEQAATLAERYTVLRYDMLGHGKTGPLARRSKLSDYCDQLLALLDFLGHSRVVLVGFSMGGVIAERFAADHGGRLHGIVLMSTVYRRLDSELAGVRARLKLTEEGGPDSIVEHVVSRWFSPSFQASRPEAVAWLRGKLTANHHRGYADAYRVFVEADAAVGDALTGVKCPALVMTGSDDVGSTPEIAQRMVNDLQDGALIVLSGLRHMVTMEAPDLVSRHLLDFVDGLDFGRRARTFARSGRETVGGPGQRSKS